MAEDKIFVGNGKQVFDNLISVSLWLTDIPQEHIFEYNGKKYIKVNINDKDTPDQYGKDVSISVDTWKPEQQENNQNKG